MGTMVRAKFVCRSVSPDEAGPCITVDLEPVIDGSEENEKFWEYTPAGSISLSTTNQEAAKLFEVGKEYYVDFTPAD